MNIFECFLYGLMKGVTEFLPVSSPAHGVLLRELFGVQQTSPLQELLIHIGLLIALLISCGTYIEKLRRERKLLAKGRHVKKQDRRIEFDLRLIQTAAIPTLIGTILYGLFGNKLESLALVAFCLCLNGIVLYLPEHVPHGNKDSSKLSAFQALLIGLGGAISALPGVSRVGASYSCAVYVKSEKSRALEWIYIISIPALVILIAFDFVHIFTYGAGANLVSGVFGCIISAITALVSGMVGIYTMRFICNRSSVGIFAFYCWGVALLSFIIFLAA